MIFRGVPGGNGGRKEQAGTVREAKALSPDNMHVRAFKEVTE